MSELLKIGTKVKVRDFPVPTGQAMPFDYNGLVGKITKAERVGFGLNNTSVYAYEVRFEDVDVPSSRINPETRRIERSIKKADAQGVFEEAYLIKES